MEITASALLMIVFRLNGIVLVLLSLLAMLLFRSEKRIALVCMAFSIVFYALINLIIIPGIVQEKARRTEAYSIPLQQIARLITTEENPLTEDEIQIVDSVVVYNGIPKRYDPDISDPVKNRYRDSTDEEWTEFISLWLRKGIEYPKVYIESFINGSFGYFYPFYFEKVLGAYQFYNKESLIETDRDIVYSEYAFPAYVQGAMQSYTNIWERLPLLSLFVNPGFSSWLLLIVFGGLICRGMSKKYLSMLSIPFANILCCMASPVNGLVRYALPTIMLTPLCVMLLFFQESDRDITEFSE